MKTQTRPQPRFVRLPASEEGHFLPTSPQREMNCRNLKFNERCGLTTQNCKLLQKSLPRFCMLSYDGLLKPVRKLRNDLIIDDWDGISRIMTSLALKSTTQSIITGKLSAYARKNKTRAALWEYDNIIRSLYLLRFIDEPPLHRNIQLVLNRGESYHKLRKTVAFANFGKLRFKTEFEQQIWQECSRLITNCIIFYNATILSTLLAQKENIGDTEGVALLKRVSLVAWQHINLHGRYEFTKSQDIIDMQEIILELIKSSTKGKLCI